MAEGNHQRAFAKSIKAQNAQQIRQSTTAAVKVIQAEQALNRPKLHFVDPLDYEGELSSRRKDLEKEQFLNLLLFPQQDVSVNEEERDHRTAVPIIPPEAQKQASNLFTHECLKFYTSKWHRVTYNYSQFACSASKVLDHDYPKQLPAETFELDLIDEEKLASLSLDHLYGSTPISRKGYLFKGPFPQDGGISVSMKSYRKRWFVLTGGPREGGYTLIFFKDEKSHNIKGKIHLDTCTEIKKNNRYKPHGFDLMTEEDKVFYPLAADSEAEMDEWISTLSKAIGLEVEETDKAGANSVSSFYSKETLVKDPKKVSFYPAMLEYNSRTEAENAQARQKDSRSLFNVCPELLKPSKFADDSKPGVPAPVEKFGERFLVKCHDLKFKLLVDRNGEKGHIEPFFITLAVFDANKGLKISEDFHVDLNSPFLRQLVPPLNGVTEPGPDPLSEKASRAIEGVFSVTFPHTEIYLVARVEKILQNGISTCAEPYIRTADNAKTTQKLAQQMTSVCSRLGQYRMPFAWAVRPLFTSQEQLDTETQFSPLFRQEKEKLTDEDILKILSDYRSLHKQKLHVIPGVLNVDVVQLPTDLRRRATLTSSLLPLKSSSLQNGTSEVESSLTTSSPIPPILEVMEFPPLEAYHPHTSYYPHISFRHHLYVYPTSLKYDGQKTFAKARNIVCCVQFKDSDDQGSAPLAVIYSKCSSATFTDRANTTVLHHCTTPSFYDEVKMKLPIRLNSSHHLLFTFYHVACDLPKGGKNTKSSIKLPPLESPVGFAWLPLMENGTGRVLSGSHNIPVSASLPPGYLGTKPPSSPMAHGSRGGAVSPEIRWVDGRKPLFRVTTNLDSTIYTQSFELHQFFLHCQHLPSRDAIPPTTMAALLSSLKALDNLSLSSIVQFLPMLMSQLFKLLCHSSKDVENIKPDVLKMLISLVDKLDNENSSEILNSYIEYMFVTEVDSSRKKAVHDELARLLVQFLRQQSNQANQNVPQLLEHLWFFLEVMLKSMGQYLPLTKKTVASRKTRYPEDFGWNLQSLVSSLLLTIREKHLEASAKKANKSLAEFVKGAFSFMDRGVVFKIVSRYLETFTAKENIQLSSLKLDFLRILCNHEHFVALNLPFPVTHENMEFSLSEEFCRKHFLIGVVLREVESCLEYEASGVRKKMFVILRDILAKLDCDGRYADPGQKARIAALFFPLVPLVLDHVTRLNPGSATYVSPMLNAASMAFFNPNSIDIRSLPNDSIAGSVAGSAAGTLRSIAEERDRSFDKRGTTPSKSSHAHPVDGDQVSLDPTIVSDVASAQFITTSPVSMDQTLLEMDKISVEETRDLLMSVLFVMKHLDRAILLHWWHECMGSSNTAAVLWTTFDDTYPSQFSQLMDFFDLLESCLYTFKYTGRRSIAVKMSSQMSRESSILDQQSLQSLATGPPPSSGGKEKLSKKSSLPVSTSSLQSLKSKPSRTASLTVSSPSASLLPTSMPLSVPLSALAPSEEVDSRVNVEAALANEVGLIILSLLDSFGSHFKKELCQDEGDNLLMTKYFSLLVSFLQVNQSLSLQTHLFAVLRAFVHKFQEALFRGSAEFCGILCYEILQCSNSRLPSTRTEATALLYLIMRCNFEYFKGRGFVRTHLQATIAVSRLVSALLGQSDSNLRRSLSYIANFVSQDEKVQKTAFPTEVKDLMKRLKTVLSSTAEMKIHQNDPEKLVDLHYSLAKSYGNSPELRQTWLDSMVSLHLKYGNYSEAAHCCIHIAGLVAEYLKIKGKYPTGCAAFRNLSPNVELEESNIKEDQETTDEQTFTERNVVALLESSISYLEQAERYEMMAEVFKLLLPFYEKQRDFFHMMEMYGKLHEAFKNVVNIMATGKRYLGTYFRVSFFGLPFGEDNEKQFIYKEPKVTALAELTLRLQKLYSRKFGAPEIVHIIKESGKVNTSALDPEHAYIQITHVEPYFESEELEKRKTKFERENKISKFVYETPLIRDGRAHGDVTKQCMRKTLLTTTHWFPYVKKRIQVIHQEQFELSAIEVAIEALEKKTSEMASVVNMDPPDLVRLQLLLQGSIRTQVNQGVQEYIVFLKEPHCSSREFSSHVERLEEAYRYFMQVCQEALELNGRLISTDQLLFQDELKSMFVQMETQLSPLLKPVKDESRAQSPIHAETFPKSRRGNSTVDPHRMSAILFHSISGSK